MKALLDLRSDLISTSNYQITRSSNLKVLPYQDSSSS